MQAAAGSAPGVSLPFSLHGTMLLTMFGLAHGMQTWYLMWQSPQCACKLLIPKHPCVAQPMLTPHLQSCQSACTKPSGTTCRH